MDRGTDKTIAAPRGRRGIFVPLLFFALGILSALGYSHWSSTRNSGESQVAAVSSSAVAAPAKKEPKILYYADPMNPSNKSDKPGKAPCGMDLVPIYDEEPESSDALPPGSIRISPEKQQMIGVQFGEASEMALSRTVRAVGRATYDETMIHHIHTRFEGYVDKVFVDFTGKLVKKGQPLLSIYSPELVATQQELLVAKKSSEIMQKSQFEGIASQSRALYKSTRERLKLWEISDQQVKEIERQGSPIRAITLHSHIDGFVIVRNVFAGHQVKPEMELYTIADLSNVWIITEIYEYEIAAIHLGQTAQVTFPSFPGQIFTGKITYIAPELDAKTRTARVRIELPNKEFRIKPDMFANVEVKVNYGKKLSIPQEAVLDSGGSQTVFVAREGGYFEPRKISLGPKVDDRYIVLNGVAAGEKVVTSANFLIDSESQLKTVTGSMAGGGAHAAHGGSPPGTKAESSSGTAAVQPMSPIDESSGNQVLKKAGSGSDHSSHSK
ncbi:MAG: efflux RND transporter periplasmic adaptor subunit [Syntrophobacteraceae bacterium]